MTRKLTYHLKELKKAIRDKSVTQKNIAIRYKNVIVCDDRNEVDWGAVNAEILKRYKPSGLIKIKDIAWRLLGVGLRILKRTA